MATRKQVEAAAAEVGLHVAYYNPGDGARWKFTLTPQDYFAISDNDAMGRLFGPAGAALLWLEGYRQGRLQAFTEATLTNNRAELLAKSIGAFRRAGRDV